MLEDASEEEQDGKDSSPAKPLGGRKTPEMHLQQAEGDIDTRLEQKEQRSPIRYAMDKEDRARCEV